MTSYYWTEAGATAGDHFLDSKRTGHLLPAPHPGFSVGRPGIQNITYMKKMANWLFLEFLGSRETI